MSNQANTAGINPSDEIADGRPDARIVERQPARGSVLVQTSRGDRCIALLRDISTYGCNLLTDAGWLREGNYLTIRLGAERTVEAIVRWTREGANGVEFLRPIPDSEADRIALQTN